MLHDEKPDPLKQNKADDLCQKICDQVKDPLFKAIPKKKEFLALPVSSQGSRWVAYIASEVAALNSSTIRNSLGHIHLNEAMRSIFATLKEHSKRPEIIDANTFQPYVPLAIRYQSDKNKNVHVTLGEFQNMGINPYWTPRLLPAESPWQEVEDTFEMLLTLDPHQHLTDFFSETAKLAWLISNINLIQSDAKSILTELVLNILFHFHQMQPLQLKAGFPPLGIMSLAFQLTDYQYVFPYLFEHDTVPTPLLKQDVSKLKSSGFIFQSIDKNIFYALLAHEDYKQICETLYLKINYKTLPPTYEKLKESIIETFKQDLIDLKIFKSLLRFLPYSQSDKIIEEAIKTHPDLKTQIETQYVAAKKMALATAPYHSRYSNPGDLYLLYNAYNATQILSESHIVANDINYGLKRADLARQLCLKLRATPDTMLPKTIEILALPASSKGTKRAAAILEAIADKSYAEQKKDRYYFQELRSQQWHTTHMSGFYEWGHELVEAVGQYSILPKIISIHSARDIAENNYEYDYYSPTLLFRSEKRKNVYIYPLNYRDAEGAENILSISALYRSPHVSNEWHHGLAPISNTWRSLEDVFEAILELDLSQVINFKKFYSLDAELVWLVGNTQPLRRGSGSYAEMLLALVHEYHHLQPPILKLDFPQLDVLDISFPLVDYQYLFPYFFEPSTIHESVRPHHAEIENLNRKEMLRTLYQKPDYREHCAKEIEYQNALLKQEETVSVWLTERMKDILSVQRSPLKLFDKRFNETTQQANPTSLSKLVYRLLEEYERQSKDLLATTKNKETVNVVEIVNNNQHDYHCLRILAMTLNDLYTHYRKLIPGWLIKHSEEVAKIKPIDYYLIGPPEIKIEATANSTKQQKA